MERNRKAQRKETGRNKGKESRPSRGKKHRGNYILGGPGPPSSSPEPDSVVSSASAASSNTFRLTLMHPTPVLPRKAKTAPVDFSLHGHLPGGP